MSKLKKAPKAKAGKAGKEKKPVKKAPNPPAKKAAAKKPSASANKNPTKKAASKSKSKAAAKTNVKSSKATANKKQAPITKQAKPASKQKVTPKKVSKKPIVVKKATAKAAPVKKVNKAVPAPAKKPQAVKPVKTKAAEKPVEVKKPVAEVKPAKTEESPKKGADKKAPEVLAITNTIPVKENVVISASRIASISQTITNPIKRPDSYSVRVEKEPAGKFEMEFVVHASADMLYEFLSTPSGLSEWFCDDLNIRNGIYTFIWEDTLQQARLLKTVELSLVRFQWVDKTDGSYFEFRIQRDDLTNDISLIITDFADSVSERESSKLLWHSQIEKLMHVIGSIF